MPMLPRRSIWLVVWLLLLAAGFSGPAPAQDSSADELPSARELWQRFIEVTGGEEAYRRIEHHYTSGRFEIPDQGLRGIIESFASAPDKLLVEVRIEGLGEVRSGFDGQVGWLIHPVAGPKILGGLALSQMREQADFYFPLTVYSLTDTMETVAEEEFDGRPSYKVRMLTNWGEEYTQYFEVGNGLIAGLNRTQASPLGDVETVTILSSFREFDDILLPTRILQIAEGVEQFIYTDSVSSQPIDPAVFALPQEIMSLSD